MDPRKYVMLRYRDNIKKICLSQQFKIKLKIIFVISTFQLQDSEKTTGESEVKFQVSSDTLGAMLRSMAYIREQLSSAVSLLHFMLL